MNLGCPRGFILIETFAIVYCIDKVDSLTCIAEYLFLQ